MYEQIEFRSNAVVALAFVSLAALYFVAYNVLQQKLAAPHQRNKPIVIIHVEKLELFHIQKRKDGTGSMS